MKVPKLSIFSHMVMAILLPSILVFVVILFAINNLIYKYNAERARETILFFSDHASEKITDSFSNTSGILRLTSTNMADAADDSEYGRESVEEILYAFLASNTDIYCAWYVFRPGLLSPAPTWFARSFLQRENGIMEIPAVPDADLMDPEKAPWHYYPYTTGTPYYDMVDHWDYGIDEGPEFVGTIGYPIIRDGEIIGTAGMDILYEKALEFMEQWHIPGTRSVMLLARQGKILYSPDENLRHRELTEIGYTGDDYEDIAAALRTGESFLGTVESPVSGEPSLVHLRRISIDTGGDHLFLYIDMPIRTLYGQIESTVNGIVFLFLGGLALTALGAFLTTRSLIRPIQSITAIADRIANGDTCDGVDDLDKVQSSGLEVDILRRSIRKMLEQVHQTHQLKLYAMEAEFERKKAEESSRARTQFFATMSHEIRTPMNAIMGISDILSSEPLTEKQAKYVKNIKASSESLLVIIDDILDIAKLEAGKLVLIPAHFNLYRMLENISSICTYLAKQKNLDFSMEMAHDVPKYIYTDEVRLKQVLLNLLGNAIKFTAAGSVRLTVACRGESLYFGVIDSGVGIREEDLPHIFTIFKQVDTVRNRSIKGTGLGLAISRNLVGMMGGEIEVKSIYGQGSTFTIHIPLVKGDASKSEENKDDADGGSFNKAAKVMVVDDNEINLQVAQGVMRLLGLSCEPARSGAEAIEKLRRDEYDLIFMDHMMPEMDGEETTRRIRAMGGRFGTLPIVALTANAVAGVRETLFAAGMDDYLTKPIRKQALQEILVKWLPSREKKAAAFVPGDGEGWLRQADAVEGLDVAAALERLENKRELYQMTLRRTRDVLPRFIENLDADAEFHDTKALEQEINSMSADLEKIGALQLAARGRKLGSSLAEGRITYYMMHSREFMEDMARLDAALRELPL